MRVLNYLVAWLGNPKCAIEQTSESPNIPGESPSPKETIHQPARHFIGSTECGTSPNDAL